MSEARDLKAVLNDLEDERNFRHAVAVKLDKLDALAQAIIGDLRTLRDRFDAYVEAQTYSMKGKP